MTADSKYTSSTGASNQSVDADHCGAGTNIVYEGVNNDEGYQMLFSANTVSSKYLLYCDACMNCQDCFACGGLRDKKYCILNKQYEKAEYERHVAQIIEQMQQTGERGEFFHPSLSPF
ncbi:MAG: hypothetical protein LBG52_01205 [Candidatus Peribacteria bacterium]|nr:hypothetical protein [Candidatus Peribacteria bacterium]